MEQKYRYRCIYHSQLENQESLYFTFDTYQQAKGKAKELIGLYLLNDKDGSVCIDFDSGGMDYITLYLYAKGKEFIDKDYHWYADHFGFHYEQLTLF